MDIYQAQNASPMLIGADAEAFDSPDWFFELKLDGERCLAYLDAEQCVLINKRNRRLQGLFPELGGINRQVRERCILDGELMISGPDGKPDFEAVKHRALISGRMRIERASVNLPAEFVPYDILYHKDRQVTAMPLERRRELLERTVVEGNRVALSRVFSQGVKLHALTVEQELEGVVAKKKNSLYAMGKRSKEWLKIKNLLDDDYVICGYILRDNQPVASLVLGQYNAFGRLVYKGRVTIGLKREDFAVISRTPKTSGHPFDAPLPPGNDGAVWIEPNLVCTAKFIARLPGGGMRQPFYKGLREDKRPEDAVEPGEG